MQGVQILQQPYAGSTVDRWNEKAYFRYTAIGKIEQAILDLFQLKVSKLFVRRDLIGFQFDSGSRLDTVILIHLILVQQLVNGLTTLATKRVVIPGNRSWSAIVSAVNTCLMIVLQG